MPGPRDLHVTPTANHQVRVTWRHPRDQDATGTRVDYKLSSNDRFTTRMLGSDVTELLIPFRPDDYRLVLRMTSKGRVNGRNVESVPTLLSVYLRVSSQYFSFCLRCSTRTPTWLCCFSK